MRESAILCKVPQPVDQEIEEEVERMGLECQTNQCNQCFPHVYSGVRCSSMIDSNLVHVCIDESVQCVAPSFTFTCTSNEFTLTEFVHHRMCSNL